MLPSFTSVHFFFSSNCCRHVFSAQSSTKAIVIELIIVCILKIILVSSYCILKLQLPFIRFSFRLIREQHMGEAFKSLHLLNIQCVCQIHPPPAWLFVHIPVVVLNASKPFNCQTNSALRILGPLAHQDSNSGQKYKYSGDPLRQLQLHVQTLVLSSHHSAIIILTIINSHPRA